MISDTEINKLKSADLLSIDIETKDPKLVTHGPGTHRKDGYICGISFGAKVDNELLNYYLPLRHPDTSYETNQNNSKIISDILKSNNAKIGANIIYDIEWLNTEGYHVGGKFNDVQYAEPLLNEYRRSYSLANLAKIHTTEVKLTNILQDYCDRQEWKGHPLSHLYKMPSYIVAEYANHDTFLPLEIFEKQKVLLESQNLYELYELETNLIPILLRMRKHGVRLDLNKYKRVVDKATSHHYKLRQQLFEWSKFEFNIGSSIQLAKIFDRKGVPYPRNEPTPLMKAKGKPGNPKLDKMVLTTLAKNYPICKTILDYRHFDTLINLFLQPYAELKVGDRLYSQFHPLRNDKYGTVSGRFSASRPNMQQVSAKDEEDFDSNDFGGLSGKIIRELFIPEENCIWGKADYSQIEYRIMAHYAVGEGAMELREAYNNDPNTDYHQRIMDETGFERRDAKRVNFGGMYGIGTDSASRLFGWSLEEADHFLSVYHGSAPYIRKTRQLVSNTAKRREYIYTILNRRARTHPSRKLHSMFNRLIQGSAADIMKKAMADAEKKGLFDILKLHLTVHDELDVSIPTTPEGQDAWEELGKTMEDAVKLDVPIIADLHSGDNWAEAD